MSDEVDSIRRHFGCTQKTALTLLAIYAAGGSWSAIAQWTTPTMTVLAVTALYVVLFANAVAATRAK